MKMIDRENSYGVRVIVQKEDRFLLVQHNQVPQGPGDIRDPEKTGLWSFPGGHFEGNESAEQAVRRELQEEFNLNVHSLDYVDELQYKAKKYLVYRAKTEQGIAYHDPTEIDAYDWFTLEMVEQLAQDRLEHTGFELSLLKKLHEQYD